jgi:hypothetical protein
VLAACGGSGLGKDVRADIAARMQAAQPDIQVCYATALKDHHKLKGMLVLQFAAAPSTGQFTDITIGHNEINEPGMQQCVIAAVGKQKLDKPQSTRVAVPSQPINFQPNNP